MSTGWLVAGTFAQHRGQNARYRWERLYRSDLPASRWPYCRACPSAVNAMSAGALVADPELAPANAVTGQKGNRRWLPKACAIPVGPNHSGLCGRMWTLRRKGSYISQKGWIDLAVMLT